MPETRKDKQLFTVGRVFFLLIVIPLSLVALLIANGILKLGETVREQAITVLDTKSQEEIKVRAINVADEIADFLRERERDVLIASILPPTEATYKDFVSSNRKALWEKRDGNIVKVAEPLYTEMALVDRTGQETIKISAGQLVPKNRLVNVADPANTTYKSDYFAQAKSLNKGEVYVSPVMGGYVNKEEFQKGKRFTGIVRFATPLYEKQGFAGVVTLTMDFRHVSRYTDNIVPTQSGHVLKADAATGNYAYLVDNRGFVIAHPNDYNIAGLATDGTPVPALTQENAAALMKNGEEVLNFFAMGFMDPAMPAIAKEAAAGKAGAKTYQFGGRTQFVAYAPIKFYSATYPKPAGFGWVGMNVDIGKFTEIATATAKKIQGEAKSWIATIIIIIVASVILLFFIVAILARGVSRSIDAEVPVGSEEPIRFDDEDDDDR